VASLKVPEELAHFDTSQRSDMTTAMGRHIIIIIIVIIIINWQC